MLSPFEHFASKRDGIDALPVSEPRHPMLPGEWAVAIFEWWKGTRRAGESKSEETFAEAARLGGRGTFTKLRDGARKPRHDTFKKLNAIAPPHLKNYGMGQAAADDGADRQVASPTTRAGYETKTREAAYIAEKLDAIRDDDARAAAMERCSEVLRKAREGPKQAQPRGSTRVRWTAGGGAR